MSSNLSGKSYAVIGGTGGLGQAISKYLAKNGAQVTVVGRTFRDPDVKGIKFVKADLSSLKASLELAKTLPVETYDSVIFTAGIFAAPKRQETLEGIERDLAVSYLNRFVILRDIVPRLQSQLPDTKPRVFIMGYPGDKQYGKIDDFNSEQQPYKALATHMHTVAANEALVIDWAKKQSKVNFYGLNPGLIKTNIRDNFLGEGSWKSSAVEFLVGLLSQSADTYAEKISKVIVSPELNAQTGVFFDKNGKSLAKSAGFTDELADKFEAASAALADKVLSS